jgi:hypothetical protein
MQHTPRETSPRTAQPTQPGDIHRAGFESVLPPDVFDELVAPRRPRILGRPVKGPHGRRAIVLAVLVLVVLAAIVVFALIRHQASPVAPAVQPAAAQQPTPAVQSAAARAWLAAAPMVRRAELVPVTVKRATLMRLPSQELGVLKWYPLPDVWGGGSVLARYCGTVERFSEIPPDPAPGDLWNVTETGAGWIYCTPAGWNHNAWIDP